MMLMLTAALLLTAWPAAAQESKSEATSDLHKRALEALERLQREKRGEDKSAQEAPAEKSKPAAPPSKSPQAAEKSDPRLPSFSEAVPVPPPPKPREAPKPAPPAPQVIRIDTTAPKPAPQVAAPAGKPSTPPTAPATPPPAAPQPARPSTPAPVSPGPRPTTYTIQAGDTFSAIAQKLYGDGARWTAIAKANPLVDPIRLKVGQVIKLPDLAAQDQERAEQFEQMRREVSVPSGEAQTVIVEPGDNLSTIAQRVYGKASQWKQIYEANKDQLESPDELKVGMKLKIPARQQSAPAKDNESRG